MHYIDDLDLNGKSVFIRADLNVPIENGKVADDNRIRASLDTVNFAIRSGAKVILASHLGRPKGKPSAEFSLKPVAERLSELLGQNVILAEDCVGENVKLQAKALKSGQVLLLENLRFRSEEEKNDAEFSRALAELCDVYVNDAFATAHRAHASTEGITRFVAEKAAGFTLRDEITYFNQAFANPKRPMVAIFGGAKVSTKLQAIKNVGHKADRIIIGGAMANTFIAAMGFEVGKSLHEPDLIQTARATTAELASLNCELVLPLDFVVANEFKGGIASQIVDREAIPADMMALDIGPKSIQLIESKLADAQTIIWNGPMGAFEIEEFSAGTFAVVDILSASSAVTVVGGGDTDRALHERHAMDKMSYVSTAGGAFLEMLEGKKLPGIVALEE